MGNATRFPAARIGMLLLAMPLLILTILAGCGSAPDVPGTPEPATFERQAGTAPEVHARVWTEGDAVDEVVVELDRPAHVVVLRFHAGGSVERVHPLSDKQLVLDAGVNRLLPTLVRSTHRYRLAPGFSRSRARTGRLVVLVSVDPVPLPTTTDMREALGNDFRTEAWPVRSVERLLGRIGFDPHGPGNFVAYHP